MKNPDIWYLKALQKLAYNLSTCEVSKSNTKDWLLETDCDLLEECIKGLKGSISEKKFYYQVGRVTEGIIEQTYDRGTGVLTDSLNGILLFEKFVGLSNEDEK